VLRLSDDRNFGRTLAALSLLAAPLMLFLGALIGPDLDDDAVKRLAEIPDNEAAYVIGGILFLIAPLVLIPGMVGTIHLLRRGRVTLGQIGAALITIGGLATMAFYGYGAVEYIAATEAGLDRAQMAELLDASEESGLVIPVIILFLGGLVLGSILLAIGLWRSRVVPVWAPIVLVLSTLVNFFGESKAIEVISFVLLFAGLAPVAMKILSIPDDDWERWTLPERGAAAPPAAPTQVGPPPA
jgi:hypothetical protein